MCSRVRPVGRLRVVKPSVLARIRSLETRVYAAVRDRRAASVAGTSPVPWSVDALVAHRFCLVVTFRRDGRPVPTPMWFGVDRERVYVRSAASDGKVKRLRNDPRALIAPCTLRGVPLGPAMRAVGRLLPAEATDVAEAAIAAHCGVERRAYEHTRARMLDPIYIELSPAGERRSPPR